MPGWLVLAGYAALGLVCLLLGALTFLLVAAPVEPVRDWVVQEVKAATGRDLTIAGATSITIFPRAAVSISNVALSAPPGMGGAPTMTAGALDIEVGLFSLLWGDPVVRRLVLTRPNIELRVDGQGRRSWDAGQAGTARSSPGPSAPSRPPAAAGSRPRGTAALELVLPSSVRLVDGTVRYVDEPGRKSQEITGLNLDAAVAGSAGAVSAKGSLSWRGETVAFEGALSSLRALLEQQSARAAFKLSGRHVEASYEGTAALGADPVLEGSLGIKAPSMRALMGWLGDPGGAPHLGAFSLSGPIKIDGGKVSLSNLSASLDDATMSGAITFETKGARPYVSGAIKLAELDLARLLTHAPAPAVAARPAPAATAPAPAPAAPSAAPPTSAQPKALPPPAPTRSAGRAAGWSDDVIDLAPLALADADLTLSVQRLVHKEVKTGPARLAFALKNKIAKFTLEEVQLYGGRGQGLLTLDGSGAMPVVLVDARLDGIAMRPLLEDALQMRWLEGRGTVAVALAGQGASERQVVGGLSGKVVVTAADGAVSGVDVGKILGAIEQGRISDFDFGPAEKTQFSELAATFVIANGVARNNDLRLVSTRLRATGEGTVDLAQRQLDYTVHPRILGAVTAPGAIINIRNIDLPVQIQGPWDNPSFGIKGQEGLVDAVKQIGKSLRSPEVQDLIKGLLGGDEGKPKPKPRELLDRLLKKP